MKFIKNLIFLLFLNFIFFNFSYSFENKIAVKINDLIITTIDIQNEANFLKILNQNLNSLDDKEIFDIAKESLIREKIKEIEILKSVSKIIIDDNYYEKFVEVNYLRYGFKDINDFHEKMKKSNVTRDKLRHKISIDAIWNQIIFSKYSSKININKEELKENILNKSNDIKNSYFLYEIVYNVIETSKQKDKFEEIKKSILQNGFENAAIKHSISSTGKIGGKIGWIEEDALSKSIKKKILELDIGKITNPIKIPGGFLILFLQDKKEITKKLDFDSEFQKLINDKTNEQLNQFSNIHFQKSKKNISIDEI